VHIMDAKKLASLFDNPNFAEWFGKSKVVDEAGNPLTAYHGTKKAFDSFDAKKSGNTDKAVSRFLGHFFTDKADEAKRYAEWNGQNGDVLETMLSIQNPYRMPYSEFDAMNMQTYNNMKAAGFQFTGAQEKAWDKAAKKSVLDRRKELQELGHDGVFVERPISGGVDEYIAFEPTQIKSVNNQGTFDPTNPNIYKTALPYAVAGGGLMSALSPSDAAAIENIRAKDLPIEEAWNPVEAFGGGLGGGLRAALAGIVPDGAMDWAINGLMSGGK
jgi:hypothetical protein